MVMELWVQDMMYGYAYGYIYAYAYRYISLQAQSPLPSVSRRILLICTRGA